MTGPGASEGTPSTWSVVAWVLCVATAGVGAGALGFLVAAFARPHAFGNRDGQGAAGLAAMMLLGAAAITLVSVAAGTALAWRLRRRGARWALPVVLLLPVVACALLWAVGRMG